MNTLHGIKEKKINVQEMNYKEIRHRKASSVIKLQIQKQQIKKTSTRLQILIASVATTCPMNFLIVKHLTHFDGRLMVMINFD